MAEPAQPFFGAERLVTALAKRIESGFAAPRRSEPALVVGVFGEWGSGKSTLLEGVHDELAAALAKTQQQELPAAWTVPIWFNAWRYEREEHLIVPLLKTARIAVAQAFARGATQDEALRSAYAARLELLTDLTVAIAQSLDVKVELPLIGSVKPASPWEFWKKFAARRKERSDEARAEIDRLASLQHEFHRHLRALTGREGELFKAQIERIRRRADAKWAAPADGAEAERWRAASTFHLNLAFFIDDLDRCLPDKAVEMLEAIKLFLEVDGCAFVLAIDDEVVERGIAHRYRDYLFQAGPRARGAAASVPITGAEYLEKIVQLPLRLTRPDRRQVERFLVETYRELFVDAGAAERGADAPDGPARRLLGQVLGVVPPVPRKLVRTVELLRSYEAVIEPRLAATGERIDRSLLLVLVTLQLFAPELYRFLRRRGARLLLEMAQWASQGEFNNLDALAERKRKDQLEGAAAAGGHFDRESYARLPELIKRCQDNRAGFDLRDLLRIVPALGAEPPLQEYFELFSGRDGVAPPAPAAPAPAVATAATTAWLDVKQAGERLQAHPLLRETARPENPEALLDGLRSADPGAWANALAREAAALRGKVLPGELFEPLLRGPWFTSDGAPRDPEVTARYLEVLGPYLDATQSTRLAQAVWHVFAGADAAAEPPGLAQ